MRARPSGSTAPTMGGKEQAMLRADAQRAVIREWLALPADERKTKEQAVAYAMTAVLTTAARNAPAAIWHAKPISRATAGRPARARSALWSMRPKRLTKDRRQKAHTGYRGLAIPLERPGARWSGSRASQSSLAVPLVLPRARSGCAVSRQALPRGAGLDRGG